MTPKEKAKELFNEFHKHAHSDWCSQSGYDKNQRIENAKQCALICVDEIISLNYQVKKEIEHKFNMNLWIKEWQEVKQEIFKL